MRLFVLVTVFSSAHAFYISKLDFYEDQLCGVEASANPIHRNPWTVFLEYYHEGHRKHLRCAGSLVTSRHVVTAAHCVRKLIFTGLTARLGEYDLMSDRDCADGECSDLPVRIKVKRIHVPTGYDGKEDDIAVLELEEQAPYTDFIRPICLPTTKIEVDERVTASGWGELTGTAHRFSHVKKAISLPVWPEELCHQTYNHKLPLKIICAGGEKGVDTCRGDSGGPLVLNRSINSGTNFGTRSGTNFGTNSDTNGRMELVGVTSSGPLHCGTEGLPGIYTSVYDHLSFIEEVIGQAI